jgi:hypothetical protein
MKRHALPFLMGILSGALGGMMGVGGGILLVPLLVHGMSLGQHEAQGTSFAFIVVTALVAAVPYLGHAHVDYGLAAWLTVGAVPGVVLGARIAGSTPASGLRRGFGVVILATAARLFVAPPAGASDSGPWPGPWNALLGVGIGALAGLLGVGGGTLLVPALVLGQGVAQHTAQGVSLLMIVPVGLVGLVSYARQGRVTAGLLPALLAGGALGAGAGALLAHRTEAPFLSRLFAIFLLAVAARMLFSAPRWIGADAGKPSGGLP